MKIQSDFGKFFKNFLFLFGRINAHEKFDFYMTKKAHE